MFLVARTSFDPLTAVATIRNQVQEIDKDQPVYEVNSMQQVLMDSISQRRFNMLLLAIFAALALVLAVVGIYAVISDSVNQRTREIGIRKALGAKETDIIKLILREGMVVVVIGVVLGLASAFGLTQLMESLLYQVKAGDKFIFLVATVVLSVVALLSIYIPARRTTKIDPIDALRQE
jgi:putative ABC transport system permease protein